MFLHKKLKMIGINPSELNVDLSLFYGKLVFKKTVDRAIRKAMIHYLGLDETYGLYKAGLFFNNIKK